MGFNMIINIHVLGKLMEFLSGSRRISRVVLGGGGGGGGRLFPEIARPQNKFLCISKAALDPALDLDCSSPAFKNILSAKSSHKDTIDT